MLNKNCMVNVKSCLVPLLLYFVFGLGCSEKTSQDTTVKRPEKKVVEEAKTDQAEDPKVNEDAALVKMVEADVTEPTNKEPEKEMVSRPAKTAMPTQSEPSSGGMALLDIKLPKPMFVGTPQNFRVAKLQKPLGKPRPPFLAPAGTKNIAFGKPIASTDDAPIIGEIVMITDGDREAADGSYVELGPFLQHVTIDLGAKHDIYAILFWHFHKQARVYFDVIVQVADDSEFTANVHTIFNSDHDNSTGLGAGEDLHYVETSEGRLVDAKGVQARYVRLYSNGNTNNDLNHYIEVEVYGKLVAAM